MSDSPVSAVEIVKAMSSALFRPVCTRCQERLGARDALYWWTPGGGVVVLAEVGDSIHIEVQDLHSTWLLEMGTHVVGPTEGVSRYRESALRAIH